MVSPAWSRPQTPLPWATAVASHLLSVPLFAPRKSVLNPADLGILLRSHVSQVLSFLFACTQALGHGFCRLRCQAHLLVLLLDRAPTVQGFLVALWCLQRDGESQRGEAGDGGGREPVLRSSRHCLHGLTCSSLRSPCPKQASSLGSSCGPRSLPEPRDFLKGRKTGRNVYKKHPNKMLTRRKVW